VFLPISIFKRSGIELGKEYLLTDFLETNIKDIYAIGDCAEQKQAIDERRPIEAVWYTGRMMGSACTNVDRNTY
jgi:pyruvate/2-oxoglutarate dehydrogenase complex dihydrolipoamide dehydrogenase (E3) component